MIYLSFDWKINELYEFILFISNILFFENFKILKILKALKLRPKEKRPQKNKIATHPKGHAATRLGKSFGEPSNEVITCDKCSITSKYPTVDWDNPKIIVIRHIFPKAKVAAYKTHMVPSIWLQC